MKSHTDLPQSQKLAEFLPLESADHFHIIGHLHTDGQRYEVIRSKNEVSDHDSYWPCWSLAALFNVLPHSINNCIPTLRVVNDSYCCAYSSKENYGDWLWFYANNSIDACYELILKLHELKML